MADVHKRMLNEILGRSSAQKSQPANAVVEKDKAVRQAISELYFVLGRSGNPELAINLLADHVAIMVDMINEFKKAR